MDEREQNRQADARLAERLLRGGVGLRHVRRTLREMRDHREDLVERMVAHGRERGTAGRDARELLGDQEILVAQMTARPELRSRARRFAWLLFIVGPLPMVCALGLLVIFAAGTLSQLAGTAWSAPSARLAEMVITQFLLLWLTPALVGLLLCRAALRRRIPTVWPICAMAMVALGSGVIHVFGDKRVTGIAIGLPPPELDRTIPLFCVLGGTYLLMRRRLHEI